MKKRKSDQEFSKRLLVSTRVTFIGSLIVALLFTWFEKDTSIFMYIIPSTGGTYGAAIIFYLNKAKMENVFKGKIAFLKYKLKLMEKYPEKYHAVIDSEMQTVDDALNSKVDSTLHEAVSEDMTIQNFG